MLLRFHQPDFYEKSSLCKRRCQDYHGWTFADYPWELGVELDCVEVEVPEFILPVAIIKTMMKAARELEQSIHMVKAPLPSEKSFLSHCISGDAEGILVANIGSYMGGVDLWQNEDETCDNFDPQSMHDKILEVVSISGA